MADNKALYRRWRPQSFADLVGQNHVKQTLQNAIRQGHVSHAYLFAGPRGTGKTSLARLVAKAVNCLNLQDMGEPCGKCANCLALAEGRMVDLVEIDAASHTGVDNVRDLIEKVNFSPSVGRYKVYIIDEVHMMTKNAFNALLKTLEEPPAHAIFILATTEVHKLPATVISRCQYFDFHYLTHMEVAEQLKKIAKQEHVQISDGALQIIADNAEGSLRDAISVMDQAASFSEGKVDQHTLEDLLGIVDTKMVRELTQSLIDHNVVSGVNLINDIYFKGYDLNQLGKLWLNYLRELLMIKLGNGQLVQKSADEKKIMQAQADTFSVSELINLLQRLVEAMNQYKVAHLPQLALEMVIAKQSGEKTTKPIPITSELNHPESSDLPAPTGTDPQAPPPVVLTDNNFAEMKNQFCIGIAAASPSVGAVLKTCQLESQGGKLIIKAPSKFLKDTLAKPANLALFKEQLTNMGMANLGVECTIDKIADQVVEATEVFGIM